MKASRALTLIFFAFVLFTILYSLRYGDQARFGPLVIGIPAAVLIITQLARESFIKKSMPEEGKTSGGDKELAAGFKENYLSYIEIAACLIGLLALVYVFGILIGFAFFIFAYLKLHKEGWVLSISLALGIPALMYGIFDFALRMALYQGILF